MAGSESLRILDTNLQTVTLDHATQATKSGTISAGAVLKISKRFHGPMTYLRHLVRFFSVMFRAVNAR